MKIKVSTNSSPGRPVGQGNSMGVKNFGSQYNTFELGYSQIRCSHLTICSFVSEKKTNKIALRIYQGFKP